MILLQIYLQDLKIKNVCKLHKYIKQIKVLKLIPILIIIILIITIIIIIKMNNRLIYSI